MPLACPAIELPEELVDRRARMERMDVFAACRVHVRASFDLDPHRDDGGLHLGNEIGKACGMGCGFGSLNRYAQRMKSQAVITAGPGCKDGDAKSGDRSEKRQTTGGKKPCFRGLDVVMTSSPCREFARGHL